MACTPMVNGYVVSARTALLQCELMLQEVASTCKVRAMPTFQIFQQGTKVEEIVGADAKTLEALCTKYNAASSPFSGHGRKLGSALFFGSLQRIQESRVIGLRTTADRCNGLSCAHQGDQSVSVCRYRCPATTSPCCSSKRCRGQRFTSTGSGLSEANHQPASPSL